MDRIKAMNKRNKQTIQMNKKKNYKSNLECNWISMPYWHNSQSKNAL